MKKFRIRMGEKLLNS